MTQKEVHEFGGGWTQLKLEVVEAYLSAYKLVMSKQAFKLAYIDAFAGSGKCSPKVESGEIDGSALRALDNDAFDYYLFIENHTKRRKQLLSLTDGQKYNEKRVQIEDGDANEVLKNLLPTFKSESWRAVCFLDPYGMEVKWETLKMIAETKAIDIWYLFPLSGIYRNAARKYSLVDEHKGKALDNALGTTDWREAFYEMDRNQDLFASDPEVIRTADLNDIERFVVERMESLFPKVLQPLRLPKQGAPLFSLIFVISNPSPKAQAIAARIAKHLIDKA